MKSKLLLIFTCFLTAVMPGAFAQSYTYTLNGNPINTTGWVLGGNASNNVTDIKLNNPTTGQNGFIYYNTPQNLSSACDYFSVSFDFQITTVAGIDPADGFAFWYIANPPSAFVQGGGIGMPASMDGFALIFDVYSNDNNVTAPNNPLITLRRFNNTGYTEGVFNGLIGSEVYNQSTLINGAWHTCTMVYQSGVMNVYLDGAATPIITGALSLNNNVGYFGFSASTGALYETHSIKNVLISGGQQPDPVTVSDIAYCVGAVAAPLTASNTLPNADLHWYTSSTGGTGSSTAPTPNTGTAGTTIWWVSQSAAGCPIESQRVPITVTVNAGPEMSINPAYAEVCKGTPVLLTAMGAPTVTWSPPDGLSATTGASVVANPVQSTTYRAIGVTPQGCRDTAITTIKVLPSYNKTLNITLEEGDSYQFGNLELMSPGTYKESFMSALGCDSTVTINVVVNYKDKKTMFPNAFTPNGDGRNDNFAPLSSYPNLVTIEAFDIFNRWGQLVYSAFGSKAQTGWDGTFNGKVADGGVYYYYARVRSRDGVEEFKGEVTLFR